MSTKNKLKEGARDIAVFLRLDRKELAEKSKDELLQLSLLMLRVIEKYHDKTCGPREAAQIFDRRKTWIYDAMCRPRTPLQIQISKIAGRDEGGLIFRLSDLLRLRDGIFENEEE